MPTPIQQETLERFVGTIVPSQTLKGLALDHKLGSGKTCTSILIADTCLKQGLVDRVFVLTTGSLRGNWVSEYCHLCGNAPLPSEISEGEEGSKSPLPESYRFVTYNFKADLASVGSMDRALVIIDEYHNFINGVKNQSVSFVQLYDLVSASDCKVLLLSGTPIYERVEEWLLIGHLLKPSVFPKINLNRFTEAAEIFAGLFTENADGSLNIHDPEGLRARFSGVISFYDPSAGSAMGEDFPQVIENEPFRIPMSPEQEQNYWMCHRKEQTLIRMEPNLELSKTNPSLYKAFQGSVIVARKRIFTRTASNFLYPPRLNRKILYEMTAVSEAKGTTGDEVKFALPRDVPESEGGWIAAGEFAGGKLKTLSMKLSALIVNIVAHPNVRHVIYTSLIEHSGAVLMETIFRSCKVLSAVFSGQLTDAQRKALLRRFNNSETNGQGQLLQVLIISNAGSEGITLKGVRHLHFFEIPDTATRESQIIGRIARFKSHSMLPPDQRNVSIWRYLSVSASNNPIAYKFFRKKPDANGVLVNKEITMVVRDKTCVDEKAFIKNSRTRHRNTSFLQVIESAPVEEVPSYPFVSLPTVVEVLKPAPAPQPAPNKPRLVRQVSQIDPVAQAAQDKAFEELLNSIHPSEPADAPAAPEPEESEEPEAKELTREAVLETIPEEDAAEEDAAEEDAAEEDAAEEPELEMDFEGSRIASILGENGAKPTDQLPPAALDFVTNYNVWGACSAADVAKIAAQRSDAQSDLRARSNQTDGIVGKYNPIPNPSVAGSSKYPGTFCLQDFKAEDARKAQLENAGRKADDARLVGVGKVCKSGGWKLNTLFDIVVRRLKIDPPAAWDESKAKLTDKARKIVESAIADGADKADYDMKDRAVRRRVLYWGSLPKQGGMQGNKQYCDAIHEFLERRNAVVRDSVCGRQGKSKKIVTEEVKQSIFTALKYNPSDASNRDQWKQYVNAIRTLLKEFYQDNSDAPYLHFLSLPAVYLILKGKTLVGIVGTIARTAYTNIDESKRRNLISLLAYRETPLKKEEVMANFVTFILDRAGQLVVQPEIIVELTKSSLVDVYRNVFHLTPTTYTAAGGVRYTILKRQKTN